ncbi:MlaD family protein [Chitinibacter tainanensis]|uniref:MlaD family protein n=1 Tax=Chitinibacter tainanensis TaxID=230667 RepID=UPI0003FC9E57|nr:MlaD family protein [Chitinibacter tainanensis]
MKQPSYFRLGLFIIFAILLGAALLIGVGSGRWWQPRSTLETYFNESVKGLDIGSKVRYRGVAIGEVTAITFTYSRYQGELPAAQRQQYVLVEAQLDHAILGEPAAGESAQAQLNREISKGLRVKLSPQGLTGTSYLEIDYENPRDNPPLPIQWKPENLYIPSANSTVNQLVSSAQDLMAKMQRLDLNESIGLFNQTLRTLNTKLDQLDTANLSRQSTQLLRTVNGLPLAQIASESSALIQEVRTSNQQLGTMLADPSLQQAARHLASAAQSADRLLSGPELSQTVARLDAITARLDRLSGQREGDVQQIIDNLNATSSNLKALSEQAKQRPSSLLFDQYPPRYTPPKP